jgi:cytochrome b
MKPIGERKSEGALVWDLPTRLFHWTLLVCVLGAFVSQWFYERIPFIVHEVFGSCALVLITFRIFWGFVGTRYARFSSFMVGPSQTMRYFYAVIRRQPPAAIGHTPTGGWMILLLLGLVGAQATLGLFANDDTDAAGPFYGWVGHALSKRLTGYHEFVANLLLAAIAIHVVAVIVYRVFLKEDLVSALWTGRRSGVPESDSIRSHRGLLALLILIAVGGALIGLIEIAPPIPEVLM